MATTKVTKAQNFATIKAILEELGKTDLVEVMNHELELLANKSANRKETAKQTENKGIKDTILEVIGAKGTPMRVKEILDADSRFDGMTTQKISALCAQLADAGELVKEYDKKIATYRLA